MGSAAAASELKATTDIETLVPKSTPGAIAYGTFERDPALHYYLTNRIEYSGTVPAPEDLGAQLARLHISTSAFDKDFGYQITTYNGDLPLNNEWTKTWEEFFSRQFRHVFDLYIKRGGPWTEAQALLPATLEKVIPWLFRPMEVDGRSVKPCLLYGD